MFGELIEWGFEWKLERPKFFEWSERNKREGEEQTRV